MPLLIGLLFSLGVASAALPAAEAPRWNILFCIADDWSYGHAGVYGDPIVSTPAFDRVAREGGLFHHAFSASPSCTPSRAAILTGQYPHRLLEGGQLHGFLPKQFPNYVDLLEQAGYAVGLTSKGWGPGRFPLGGYARNPAGPHHKSFAAFLEKKPADQPFCFWLGSVDPHRPYDAGTGKQSGMAAANVRVPKYWPDVPAVREDILDYYFEVQRFDQTVEEALRLLEERGELNRTVIVITADNGMPFPRCKANLYDGGTRQPLAIRWPGKVNPGLVSHAFVNLMDLAPTFLEIAGLSIPAEMTGRSLVPLVTGKEADNERSSVMLERERHAYVRRGGVGYPVRALRTAEWLYIRNYEPSRWPAGDPESVRDPASAYGDVDDSPTKDVILAESGKNEGKRYYDLCFGKRPAEELYDLTSDPDQVRNVATDPAYGERKAQMEKMLQQEMERSGDGRARPGIPIQWDDYPYFGGQKKP